MADEDLEVEVSAPAKKKRGRRKAKPAPVEATPVVKAEPPPEPAPDPVVPDPYSYEVVEKARYAVGGLIMCVAKGTIVCPVTHDIEAMKSQGVKLKEV